MKTLELNAAMDPSRCGHKAATLAALRRAGHNIPDGFVIPAGTSFDSEALRESLSRLGAGPFAVRSSGVAEDLPTASHAGEYVTVLGVDNLDDVVAAAARVVASGGDSAMGVLVQRLVVADAAGVAFTANPVTGDDEVVIEATSGLGDRLLDGAIDGERWTVRNGTAVASIVGSAGAIDGSVAERVAELARRIADERGAPQDVEWAIAGGELYVLQARPITGLPRRPDIQFPPGRWMKDTSHFNGPMTVVGASILLPAYERAFTETFAEFGLLLDTIRQRSFGGEVYTQEVDVGGKHDPSAPPPWWVLAIAARVVPAMRQRIRAAETAAPKLETYPQRWEDEWRDECTHRIEAARRVDLQALDDGALLDELGRVIDEVLDPHLVIHFQLTWPHMVGVYELVRCCEELLGWELSRAMTLLTGLSSATTRATFEIEAIDGPGLELDAWIERWGLRTIDADPGSPMLSERPDLIRSLLRREPAPRATERERQASIEDARSRLSGADRERFDRALTYAEIVYPQRDDNVVYTEGLPCGLVRRVLVEIGRRLVTARKLETVNDVSLLEHDELRGALAGGETLIPLARRRQAERAWVLAHPGPHFVGPPPVPSPDVRGLPRAVRRIMRAVLWAVGEELTPPEALNDGTGDLVGTGVSPGIYRGPARIIRTEAELSRLEPGDVLVCPTTHSSWAAVFAHAGALVCDGGGMLSHPSIIAREHGVPAVVGTGNATTLLKEGELITVDGGAGIVRR